MARQGSGSLCGIELAAHGPVSDDTNRHCLPCMTRFQQLLDAADKNQGLSAAVVRPSGT
ncbi:hypothetical protein ABZT03_23865 [Streptomyces sp. NPDC005574]|uniref:hypothetical protein n=1 Tax=Streptomyces sp. NPDC005574 TaxID=3156891 RepID=UPI0033AD9284